MSLSVNQKAECFEIYWFVDSLIPEGEMLGFPRFPVMADSDSGTKLHRQTALFGKRTGRKYCHLISCFVNVLKD